MKWTVRITGWNAGFLAVSAIQAIRRSTGIGLADAKRRTERVMDGAVVEFDFVDRRAADVLARELTSLRAIASVVERPDR